jgi:hypothetical protein
VSKTALERQEKFYPSVATKSLLAGVSDVTGESKSSIVITALTAYFKTLKPEVIEAAKFRRTNRIK